MNRKIVSTLVALCLFVGLQGQAILHTNPVAQSGETNPYGPEMLINGDFTVSTGWTLPGSCGWVISGGVAAYTCCNPCYLAQYQASSCPLHPEG